MQTPALFVLRNNLLEGEAKENMIARLRANFLEHNQCLQTGFLGTSVLLPTLTGNGMADVAYDLLFQHRNPGWFYSIDNGATTIWERWDSYTTEKGLASNGMNSFNHYAYGCVCQWLWQTAAGIQSDPAHPGFTHFILAPIPDKRLVSVDASYESAAGLIQSEWHYKGDTCIWNFTIPEGTTATVITGGEKKEYGAGRWQISNPPAEEAGLQQTNYNKCTKRWHDGRLVITTPHGSFDALGQKIKE
jgi:alpha-L-rhamnosidase